MSNKKSVKRNIRFIVFALLFAILGLFNVILSACGDSAITLAEDEITMYVSDSARLEYTVADEDAEITWTSSNEDVATVRRGTVLAKAVGEATITATVNGSSDTCKVTVLNRTVCPCNGKQRRCNGNRIRYRHRYHYRFVRRGYGRMRCYHSSAFPSRRLLQAHHDDQRQRYSQPRHVVLSCRRL